jgi:hypothetical protein
MAEVFVDLHKHVAAVAANIVENHRHFVLNRIEANMAVVAVDSRTVVVVVVEDSRTVVVVVAEDSRTVVVVVAEDSRTVVVVVAAEDSRTVVVVVEDNRIVEDIMH